ncbi:MAG: hypothetical protein U1E25_12100 [Methylocystis sp.]
MKKLLIVPAVLAMTCLSGSAFAQRTAVAVQNTGSGVTATNSPAIAVVSPTVGLNGNVNAQASFLNAFGSGNQSQTSQQAAQGNVGISGGNSASFSR